MDLALLRSAHDPAFIFASGGSYRPTRPRVSTCLSAKQNELYCHFPQVFCVSDVMQFQLNYSQLLDKIESICRLFTTRVDLAPFSVPDRKQAPNGANLNDR